MHSLLLLTTLSSGAVQVVYPWPKEARLFSAVDVFERSAKVRLDDCEAASQKLVIEAREHAAAEELQILTVLKPDSLEPTDSVSCTVRRTDARDTTVARGTFLAIVPGPAPAFPTLGSSRQVELAQALAERTDIDAIRLADDRGRIVLEEGRVGERIDNDSTLKPPQRAVSTFEEVLPAWLLDVASTLPLVPEVDAVAVEVRGRLVNENERRSTKEAFRFVLPATAIVAYAEGKIDLMQLRAQTAAFHKDSKANGFRLLAME